MKVSILGLGAMGSVFAARALERGHDVVVWNRTPGKADALVAAGARLAASAPDAVGDADVALCVVADDAAVIALCVGGGVLDALGPATVLANVSTVSPATARRLADLGPEGRVLDAPVMGSPDDIASGFGRFVVGGPEATVTALEPLWNDLGSGALRCGGSGAGATVKVISNLLLITGVAAMAEGIATARRHGISDDLLRTVLGESMVISPASRFRLENVLDGGHPGWFTPKLARKDVRLALELAAEGGVAVAIGPATEALLNKVADGDWADFASVIEALR